MIKLEKQSENNLILNIGPSHPAMHGTIRIVAEVDGEKIVNSDVEIGYLHRGFEKTAEYKTYHKIIPYTDRLNYTSPLINNHGFVLAVEKLLGVEIPERAQIIRVIMDEMARITDHLIDVAAMINETGAITVLLYMMEAREYFWDVFEHTTGARMTTSYIRIGGVKADVPENFRELSEYAIKKTRKILKEVDKLISKNAIFLKRTRGVGIISKEDALSYGFTGPLLRATGILYDIRKFVPYSIYHRVDFEIPLGENGDVYDRYWVRMQEMEQSMRIIEQALDLLDKTNPEKIQSEDINPNEAIKKVKNGETVPLKKIKLSPNLEGMEDNHHKKIYAKDKRFVPPSKQSVFNSIEGLVHQFLFVMEGYGIRPPVGEVYSFVEGGNGELGFYLVSDGSDTPYKLHVRAPSFHLMSSLSQMIKGHYIADVIPIFGSINMIGGETDR